MTVSFGQRKNAANRYFKEFAYVKSAELYEAIYKKGDSSQVVLARLGDAYYLNSNTEKAAYWYEKLFHLYEKEKIAAPFYSKYAQSLKSNGNHEDSDKWLLKLKQLKSNYFKYAQSLKSNGNYKDSDKWLLKLEQFKGNDSRLESLLLKRDYLEAYTENSNTYVNLRNLSINTKFSDYGVFMMADKVLFSSSRPKGDFKNNKLYSWNKQPFFDIYDAKEIITETAGTIDYSDFTNVTSQGSINTEYHDASAIVTKDGKTMYFTRDNYDGKKLRKDKNNTVHLKIYSAEFVNNKWTNIKDLSFNSNDYSSGQPALSTDETELYFVSDMPGGFGGTDLYKTTIFANSRFSKPVNLGTEINTEGKEMFPFVSAENILYFSSNGHIGLGGLDVFESKISEKGYQRPTNLGAPINSMKNDFSFILNKEKKIGYFSSNRDGGKGDDDIYSFVIDTVSTKEAAVNIKCNGLLAGTIVNEVTQKVVVGANVKLIDNTGKVIDSRIADAQGMFSFGNVACNLNYTVVVQKDHYVSDRAHFLIQDVKKVPVPSLTFKLTPLIIDDQIVVNPIQFNSDSSMIREDASYELEKVVSVLKAVKEIIIKITAHTDANGKSAYNLWLSDRRAKATRDYLISRGIPAYRIQSTIGYGENMLLNECGNGNLKKCTEEEHQLNRRSHFYIVRDN
jgi:outer membrane protein OmpA-like peptidoglycan-associated protein/tetratricopeptide (TPR) repeat protein